MSFKLRYVLIAAFNCSLLLGYLYLGYSRGWNLSKRLIDMNFGNSQDLSAVFTLLGMLIGGLLINFLLLSPRTTEISEADLKKIVSGL